MNNVQLDLFTNAYEEYKDEISHTEEKTEEVDYRQFNVCPKCKVLPITYKVKARTIDSGDQFKDVARCPICGYMVADYYDIYEHWNKCNEYRVRDGKI